MGNTKTYPAVGDKLYLRQFTGNGMVDMVKHPYTVVGVTNTKVLVQECELLFDGPRYYNTVADEIKQDPEGDIKELTWHAHRGMWGTPGRDSDYPEYAVFGTWEHQPYLD